MRDRVGFVLEAESLEEPALEVEQEPIRIALLGDWSGRKDRKPLASRRPIFVDRDEFDAVLGQMGIQVETPAGSWEVREFDDFHPDALHGRLPAFQSLREAGSRPSVPLRSATRSGDLLEDLLAASDEGSAAAPARSGPITDVRQFAAEVARPHLVPRPGPERDISEETTLMRSILHSPEFQRAEALWRSLFLLVRHIETSVDLKIFLLDVTREELATQADEVRAILRNRSAAWGLVVMNFAFGTGDTAVLENLGQMGSPVIGEADLSLLGDDTTWQEFRRTEAAMNVGLALPRVLLRLPYGASSSPCESFRFEEIDGKPDVKKMLWGNPAMFCAQMMIEEETRITGLPVFTYREDGEVKSMPGTELELTESMAEALLEIGIMPLLAVRNSDTVQAMRFQSVSNPPMRLMIDQDRSGMGM